MQSRFQLTLKVFSVVKVQCKTFNFFYSFVFMELAVHGGICQTRTGLGLLHPMKENCNVTKYEYILIPNLLERPIYGCFGHFSPAFAYIVDLMGVGMGTYGHHPRGAGI